MQTNNEINTFIIQFTLREEQLINRLHAATGSRNHPFANWREDIADTAIYLNRLAEHVEKAEQEAQSEKAVALRGSYNLSTYMGAGGQPHSHVNQSILDQLVHREVGECVSYLFSTIAKAVNELGKFGDTSDEEIMDLLSTPPDYEQAAADNDWYTLDEALEKANEALANGDKAMLRAIYDAIVGEPDTDDIEDEEKDEDGYPDADTMNEEIRQYWGNEFIKVEKTKRGYDIEESSADNWEELCNDERIDVDDYRREVFEHWIVTEWAAGKLREAGHAVGEVEGLTVWGRPTTGQAIAMDGVWLSIAAEMQILEGQQNDWSRQ